MKIAFFFRHFTERGTEIAAYDYADYAETLLGHTSIVIAFTPAAHAQYGLPFVPEVFAKVRARFPVFLVSSFSEVDPLLRREGVDIYYTLTHGGVERPPYGNVTACTSAVHCVFEPRVPHGDIYFTISPQVNERFGTSLPVVPHLVRRGTTKETLRSSLGIPEDAIVVGRHGGSDTFDNPDAQTAVVEAATANPNLYFLFLNTDRFTTLSLPNLIHLPRTVDVEEKQRFINTCDAYLHGRRDGETFGLAVAEFAVAEKPILACTRCTDTAHLRILGDKVYRYTTKEDLVTLLQTFKRGEMDMRTNGYMEFTPERVMATFQQVVCAPRIRRVHFTVQQSLRAAFR